jgi:CubicO group peptidase (beta-lactamase class C family)
MKNYSLLMLLLFSISTGYSQDKQKDYSEAFRIIEVWLDAQKDYDQLPGISASVIDDQEVIWSGAFGYANPENHVESKPSTLYSICSISKLFTSVAIMKLYEEELLRLDDKVSDLLPWYDLEQKFGDSWPVTVRTLLTHSSGLPREANFPYWTGPDFPFPPQESIRAELKNQETLYPSSTYFQYSNLGLTLLGVIVEEVSGIPYDDYVQQNILGPLELENTRTELPEDLYGQELAIGHGALMRDQSREKVDLFQANGITPAAGFSSNVLDLGKFSSWQFRLLDSTLTEVLQPSTLKYMQNVHWTDPDWNTTWGLGFNVSKGEDDEKWVGHGGSCPGYRSSLKLLPGSKRAYSVMINAGGTTPDKYVYGIHDILNKAEDPESNETFNDIDSDRDLTEYTGYFSRQPWGSELYVSTWYGKLVMIGLPAESPADAMVFFKHMEDDTFRRERDDGELGEVLEFERDESGQITRFKRHGNYTKKIIPNSRDTGK